MHKIICNFYDLLKLKKYDEGIREKIIIRDYEKIEIRAKMETIRISTRDYNITIVSRDVKNGSYRRQTSPSVIKLFHH